MSGSLHRLGVAAIQGRPHVHLDAIGHPILGDLLYGRPDEAYLSLVAGEGDAREHDGGPRRQLLHCARLVLPDPAGDGELELTAPLPPDFGPWGGFE